MVTHSEETAAPDYTSAWRSRLGGMTVIILAVVMLILDSARLTSLWPCDIACQGGAHYQHVAGISVIWFALFSHAGLVALSWRDVRRGGWCPWYIRLVWFLSGISLFFLWVANALDVVCPYCLIIHFTTFSILALSVPFPRTVRWWQSLSWLIAGFLVSNFVFHHAMVRDVAPTTIPTTNTQSATSMEQQVAANRGRTYGATTAPRTLEIIIDLTCRHCAEQYEPLMEALQPAINQHHVRVIVRHLVRPSQPAALPATELAVAAAALDQHAIALSMLLGTNPDASASGLTNRLADVVDITKLSPLLTTHHSAISAVITEDQQRIGQLGLGPRTPSAALIDDGRVTQRWSGDLPITSIVTAVTQP